VDAFPDNDVFAVAPPASDDDSPEEIWQRLLDMAGAAIRFGQEADVAVFGVTDQEAWAGAISRLDAALNGGPCPDLPLLVNASRELVALVTASPRKAIERGGISAVDVSLAAAVAIIQDLLVELDARRASSGK
jgi:hypothetical protein